MSRVKKLKRLKKRLTALLSLLLVLLLLSAFHTGRSDNRLNRAELSLLLETILEESYIVPDFANLPHFTDLAHDRAMSISRVLSCRIIEGFSDGSFRPDEPVRNIETLHYLQKTAEFLRNNSTDSFIASRLMRALNYQNSPGVIFADAADKKLFLKELADAVGFIEKKAMSNLVAAILGKDENRQCQLTGRVINAITGNPVACAYIAGEKRTAVTDEAGYFKIDFTGIKQKNVLLLAAAEDFMPLEIKKDLSLSSDIVFRLRPEKSQMRAAIRPGSSSR